MDGFLLPRSFFARIINHAELCLPEEACGLMGGPPGSARMLVTVTNRLHSPVRFLMEPQEQLEAMLAFESHGWDVTAIFHSHPRGPEGPSATDIAEFYYPGALSVILSPAATDWQARGFLIENGQVTAVSLIWEED